MYIEAVPNRNSPPAILLRESYRVGGKIKKRTLLNLSNWSPALVEGLRALLKGGTVLPPGQEAIKIRSSLSNGHFAAVLGTLQRIGLDRLLGPVGTRRGDLVMALIVPRPIRPQRPAASARRSAWERSTKLSFTQRSTGRRNALSGGRPGSARTPKASWSPCSSTVRMPSRGHLVKGSGPRWLSAMPVVRVPWVGRLMALPLRTLLVPSGPFYTDKA